MKLKTAQQKSIVTGKEQYYLIIINDKNEEYVMSVGKKTYNRVNIMNENEKIEIFTETEDKKNKNK